MKKLEPLKAETDVLTDIDKYLGGFVDPPPAIHVSQKQAADVRRSRKRREEPRDTDDYLNFKTYKGINIIVLEDSENDQEAEQY